MVWPLLPKAMILPINCGPASIMNYSMAGSTNPPMQILHNFSDFNKLWLDLICRFRSVLTHARNACTNHSQLCAIVSCIDWSNWWYNEAIVYKSHQEKVASFNRRFQSSSRRFHKNLRHFCEVYARVIIPNFAARSSKRPNRQFRRLLRAILLGANE